jgi:hypothetical protein
VSVDTLVDAITKVISCATGVATLCLAWTRILPRLDEIHTQTNSLALKAEAAARAMGVLEGLKQASEEAKGLE